LEGLEGKTLGKKRKVRFRGKLDKSTPRYPVVSNHARKKIKRLLSKENGDGRGKSQKKLTVRGGNGGARRRENKRGRCRLPLEKERDGGKGGP